MYRMKNRFFRYKESRGMTLQDIARRTGLSYATLARLCTPDGEYAPFHSDTLLKLCECFGVGVADLVEVISVDDSTILSETVRVMPLPPVREREEPADETGIHRAFFFWGDCCEEIADKSASAGVRKNDLYDAYVAWFKEKYGEDTMHLLSRRSFADWMREHIQAVDGRNGRGQWVWRGVRVLFEV